MRNHEDSTDGSTLDRRRFLGRTALGTAAALSAPAWLPRVSHAGTAGTGRDTLVVIFLRGGADGLTLCVPYGDPELYNRRPVLAIRPPGNPNGATNLDGFYGLAPASVPLLPAYQAGHLAFVHATGLSDPSRSHFDMQRWMDYGVTGATSAGVFTGWVGRYLQTIAPVGSGLLRGIGIDGSLPRALAGGPACVPVPNPAAYTMPGASVTATARRNVLTTMYQGEPAPLGPAALDTFATIDLLGTIDFVNYVPYGGAVYPATTFGNALKSAAALIKANIGIEAIEADLGGWDLHSGLGPINGSMATKMDELTRALAAFHTDLDDPANTLDRVTTVAMSEFGRRAGENASAGADHGHGNCMIVMGGNVNGGQVLGSWPGLAPGNLDNGDLAITVDYRDVLAEILTDRMACTSLGAVFPSYTIGSPLGVT
jgi:uncharacterized protein (DUF1501 family)